MASCRVCIADYDTRERPPVVLPCGHTICQLCAGQVPECPSCRAPLPEDRATVPHNFALLELLEVKQSIGPEGAQAPGHDAWDALVAEEGGTAGETALVLPAQDIELTARTLGYGPTGHVVLGSCQGTEVAVKLMPLPATPGARQALLREVRRLARVSASCRWTVQLRGVSIKDGCLALVMRRYDTNLTQHISSQPGGRLSATEALLLAKDLLRGLAELHAHGVVVADLKPENVLLDAPLAQFLCDVSVGHAVRTTAWIGLGGGTTSTPPRGALNYIAPEQLAVGGDEVLTPQADMWALAATLLHALTGKPPPIPSQVPVDVNPHLAPDLPPDLPPPLLDLLASCLQPNPRERPSALAALEAVQLAPELALRTEILVHVHMASASDLSYQEQPADTLRLEIPVKVDCGDDWDGRLGGRLRPSELHSATQQLQIPPGCRRYLLRTAAPGGRSRLLELSEAGEDLLPDQIGEGRELQAQQVVVVDTRLPLPRVAVVLNGQGVAQSVEGVHVDYTDSSIAVTERALRSVPPFLLDDQLRGRRFGLRVNGQNRDVTTLVGSGLVRDGGEFHVFARTSQVCRIFAKTLTGKTITLEADLAWSVAEAKRAIEDKEGIPPHLQRLIFGGALLDDELMLHDCGIRDEATLHLLLHLRKPVICIWPGENQPATQVVVRLQLSPRWYFSSLVPRPDRHDGTRLGLGGRRAEWRVTAQPDGTLTHPGSGGRQYSYLFWEALAAGGCSSSGSSSSGEGGGGVEEDRLLPELRGDRRGSSSSGSSGGGHCGDDSSSSSAVPWGPEEQAPEEGAGGGPSPPPGDAAAVAAAASPAPLCSSDGKAAGGASTVGFTATGPSCPAIPAPASRGGKGLGPPPPDLPLPDFDAARSFCVAGADVATWLYGALEAFGLPVRERTDFLTYWLPYMEGAPWLLIAFADPDEYRAAAALSISPQPDVLVRLFMMFERLQAPVEVYGRMEAELARVGVLRRWGCKLAVLEWGGMEVVRRPEG